MKMWRLKDSKSASVLQLDAEPRLELGTQLAFSSLWLYNAGMKESSPTRLKKYLVDRSGP